MELVIDNLKISYTEYGEGEIPVLLLHGWGSSSEVYKGIMAALSDRCRLVAMDFPGCGGSDTMDKPWNLDDYCDLVVKFADAVGLKNPILMGHSHGGRVTLKLAATGMMSPPKIVLLDAAGIIPKKSFKQKARAKSFKLIKGALSLPIIRDHSAGLLDRARRHYGSADYNAAPEVLRKTLVSLVNTDLRDILPNIKASTLLIWGENDTATPLNDAKIIESKISDAGLCVIKGAGHFAFAEAPAQTIAILNSFLG